MRKKKREKLVLLVSVVVAFSVFTYLLSLADEEASRKSGVESSTVRTPSYRMPVAAGRFYPADKIKLKEAVEKLLHSAGNHTIPGRVKALIVPHAGCVYSGTVAAEGMKVIPNDTERVVIIASNHNGSVSYSGVSILNVTHYRTPLGDVELSSARDKFFARSYVKTVPGAHGLHMIEVELPFLQVILGDFTIMPMILGSMDDSLVEEFSSDLASYDDGKTLFFV